MFEGSDPPTLFVVLVPVSGDEFALIGSHGWEWFDELLDEGQTNVLDLARAGIRH